MLSNLAANIQSILHRFFKTDITWCNIWTCKEAIFEKDETDIAQRKAKTLS